MTGRTLTAPTLTAPTLTALTLTALALIATLAPGAAMAERDPQSVPGNMSGSTAPHIHGTSGSGPELHRPVPMLRPTDVRQAPHLDNRSDGPVPHHPGPEPHADNPGPAPHLDNTTDGPTPHKGAH